VALSAVVGALRAARWLTLQRSRRPCGSPRSRLLGLRPASAQLGDRVFELGTSTSQSVVAQDIKRGEHRHLLQAPVATEDNAVIRHAIRHAYAALTETVIGRDAADVVLDDAQVSRRHATIRWVDRELQLEDLQSTNGTWLNGARVEGSRELQHGDVVTIGPFAIEVRSDPGKAGPGATVLTG
jgi:FHA domain